MDCLFMPVWIPARWLQWCQMPWTDNLSPMLSRVLQTATRYLLLVIHVICPATHDICHLSYKAFINTEDMVPSECPQHYQFEDVRHSNRSNLNAMQQHRHLSTHSIDGCESTVANASLQITCVFEAPHRLGCFCQTCWQQHGGAQECMIRQCYRFSFACYSCTKQKLDRRSTD